jgi:hypothetical protein
VTSHPVILSPALLGGMMLVLVGTSPASSEQITNATYLAHVNVDVLPVAEISIIGSGLLYLNVPPPGSTVPSSGVSFVVSGNANASLVAEPSQFVEVAGEGFMGKAVLNAGEIGYKLELRFPRTGAPGSPIAIAALPGYEAGPTTPPLSVNLMATGGQRSGVIHMESDPNWTSDGGIPLPGLYVGQVTLTLTAF